MTCVRSSTNYLCILSIRQQHCFTEVWWLTLYTMLMVYGSIMRSYRHIFAVVVIPTASKYDRRLRRHVGGVEWSGWNDLMQSDVCGNCGHISATVSSSSSSSSKLFITLRRTTIRTEDRQQTKSKDIIQTTGNSAEAVRWSVLFFKC